MKARDRDRGASAVEFAIVAPVLVLMLLGILAFGHAFHVQSVLSNAARDGVRVMALQDTSGGVDPQAVAKETAISSASPSASISAAQISIIPSTCEAAGTSGPGTATVTISYPMQLLGGLGAVTLTGKGTMRCNG
ncbi:TadE/TadG family type IV pilus assembly protein [Nesterenkonia lutea]|uniref:Flp pilus assembly protein TadG n=1 Tax=Nesterenkonia lutea TaxID=272919 RepID=A0ABR9JI40_9MICC|nr:TadE family protein [Nesterenkonia lutea]MBE1525177.1 Flp pilus assembly protein TadG [Nesterenkonia lutea]